MRQANFQNAQLIREEAEIAVVEYQEGIYVMNLAEIQGDIKIAEAELALAQEELNSAKAIATDKLAIKRLELAVLRAQFGLEKGQHRKKVLVDYTKGRTIKQLISSLEKTRSDELAKKATWELETSKEKKLERQIASCTIVAPRDGILIYDSGGTSSVLRNDGTTIPLITEGATVRERQLLFEIIPAPEAKPKSR